MDKEQIERISKALGDETRLMIFADIGNRGRMNCGEIVELQDVTPATVSHHLKILLDAGLIETEKLGQFVYSEVVPKRLEEYYEGLKALVGRKKSGR